MGYFGYRVPCDNLALSARKLSKKGHRAISKIAYFHKEETKWKKDRQTDRQKERKKERKKETHGKKLSKRKKR